MTIDKAWEEFKASNNGRVAQLTRGELVRIPSGYDKSDLIWAMLFSFWAGMFVGIFVISYIIGGIYGQ